MKNVIVGLITGVLVTIAVAISGCASTGDVGQRIDSNDPGVKLALQYATMKTVEESSFTAQDVYDKAVEWSSRVGATESVAVDELKQRFLEEVGYDTLEPSDKLLVSALLSQIDYSLQDFDTGKVISQEQQVRLQKVLDWIAEAAVMSGAKVDAGTD